MGNLDPDAIAAAAGLIARAHAAWALTGAGVSTPSGIPDFRGPDGLWAKYDPERFSSLSAFLENPREFFDFWIWRFEKMRAAAPNPVHEFLAWLEARGMLKGVITQNIDGLHQAAGSRRVLEVHGSAMSGTCLECGRRYPLEWMAERARRDGVPRCEVCGGLVKPDVVLFGESLTRDFQVAQAEVIGADLLLVLGTSLAIWPVAGLVPLAAQHGARIIMANRDPTPYDDLAQVVLRGELVEIVGALRAALEGEDDRA
jgi:NAD-dependent deacetylase